MALLTRIIVVKRSIYVGFTAQSLLASTILRFAGLPLWDDPREPGGAGDSGPAP